MTPFTLVLMDCTRKEQIDGAHSFVATDRSGRFGLQAGHETFVTCLQPGLARYKTDDSHWHYTAQPGATLWFHNNRLQLMTTQFVLSDSRQQLLHLLETRWQQESETQDTTLRNVTQMEQALARRLWEMNQQGGQL